MSILSRLLRLLHIQFIIVRYNLDEIVLGRQRFYLWRCLIFLNPYYWLLRHKLTRGERIRYALEALGPIFIKMGQILSTRFDWLPEDIIVELAKLQDQVPPFSGEKARILVEQALQCHITDIFAEFDIRALASASIAQVHAAVLKNGDEVVVKVLRPSIRQILDQDIGLLRIFSTLAERYSVAIKQFKPKEIVQEIAQTLYDELDLLREAANAAQLRRNFSQSTVLYIPKIYWNYSCQTVLVIERVHGIPIHQVARLQEAGVSMPLLAERGVTIFFTQIFRDSFFHADLHPGNLFVEVTDPADPKYMMVDFGIVGSLSPQDQRYIAENMVAFLKRDYYRVTELHLRCGWLPQDTNVHQFAAAIRAVCEPIFERSLEQISFGELLLRLFQVARRFRINVQPQLVLLQKTLLNIESLGRQLDPSLNLWKIATPQIEGWLNQQIGMRALFATIRKQLPWWSMQCAELPTLIYDTLRAAKQHRETSAQETIQIKAASSLAWYSKCVYFLSGMVVVWLASSLFKYFVRGVPLG